VGQRFKCLLLSLKLIDDIVRTKIHFWAAVCRYFESLSKVTAHKTNVFTVVKKAHYCLKGDAKTVLRFDAERFRLEPNLKYLASCGNDEILCTFAPLFTGGRET
jgi:hypothetical protein